MHKSKLYRQQVEALGGDMQRRFGVEEAIEALKKLPGVIFKVSCVMGTYFGTFSAVDTVFVIDGDNDISIEDLCNICVIDRTGTDTGITAYTSVYFRVKLHHNLLVGTNFFNVVSLFDKREEGERRNIHIVFNCC
jgi:hypothetical protein